MPITESIDISFAFSPLIWVLAFIFAAIFTFLAYRITNPPLKGGKRALLIVLRFIAFTAILLMLLEPLVSWITTRAVEPHVAILWHNSLSMSLSDRSGDRENVVRQLRDSKSLSQIRGDFSTDEFIFTDSLRELAGEPTLDGEATAIGRAILQLRRHYSGKEPIGAAIIVTDGQANYGEDPLSATYRAEFPIYTIGVGDPTSPKDLVVRQLTAQKVAYVGAEFPIIAGITTFGYGEKEVTVRLSAAGKKIDEKKIALAGDGKLVDVTFSVMPDSEGVFTYRVSVPSLDGELTAMNNARNVRVKVLPSKKRILVVSAEPTWELTFFLRALSEDPDLVVETAFSGKASHAGDSRIPSAFGALNEFDAVAIVGDIGIQRNLGPELVKYIESGGAIYLHILNGITLDRTSAAPWKRFLPFDLSPGSNTWTKNEFVPNLTVEGLVHPVTRISEDVVSPGNAYAKLPPLTGFAMISGNPKGTSILMNHPRLTEAAIVTVRQVDRGRVLLLNGAGFWRWGFVPFGFGGDNRVYTSLIHNGMAWLLAAGEVEPFTVEADRPVYRSGERVILTARLLDKADQPLDGAQVSALVYQTESDTSIAETLNVVMEERGGGLYTTELPTIGVGNWRVAASAELEDQRIGSAWARFLVEPYSLELENVQLNESLLREIAQASGGRYFRAEEFDSLPELLIVPEVIRRETHEKALWDHPLLLVIFVLALCCEWVFRRRWDLP